MKRRDFTVAVLGIACASIATAMAQRAKVWRIAHLTSLSEEVGNAWLPAFREGMKDLGYVEGRNMVIDARFAAGHFDRLPRLAEELSRLDPDIFLAYGPEAARAANRAAPRLPIVLANAQDPVASGLVTGLARPGGNITGMSDYHAASSTKRLELLKEALPGVSRIAVLWRPGQAAHARQVKELQAAASALGVRILPLQINTGEDVERALRTIRSEGAGAVMMLGDALLSTHMSQVIEFGLQAHIATMYTTRIFAQKGGLMSYGTDIGDLFRRSASHVDKILRGAKPGDLPIEQPVKFDLVLNLKTAKALGLTIPPSILLRADRVID